MCWEKPEGSQINTCILRATWALLGDLQQHLWLRAEQKTDLSHLIPSLVLSFSLFYFVLEDNFLQLTLQLQLAERCLVH